MRWESIKLRCAEVKEKIMHWFKNQEMFMGTAFKKYQKNIDPWTKHTYRFSIAFYTIYAAYQSCITIIPLALSVGAIFVSFPEFFFNLTTPLATLLFLGVSLVVGYFKYKNLLHQERLEQLVEEHEEKIHQLAIQIQTLQPTQPVFTPTRDHLQQRSLIPYTETTVNQQKTNSSSVTPH